MIRRDKIFYSACGIFLAGVILAVMGYEYGLLLIVGAYLLRPTLHAFDLAPKHADERQVQVHSRSGNIAFIAVMITAVGMALQRVSDGGTADEFYTLIGIGVAARALFGLFMIGETRRTGMIIVVAVGVVTALFALASAGFTTPGLFVGGLGLAFAALGLVARKYPRIVAGVLAVIALAITIGFELYRLREAGMAMLVAVLIIFVAAVSLYFSSRPEGDDPSDRWSKPIRAAALGAVALFLLVSFWFVAPEPQRYGKTEPGTQAPLEITEIDGIAAAPPFDHYPSGKLRSCTLARADTLSGQPLAAGTVIHVSEDGVLDWCFLQEDTEIQGHLCRGSGHGFMTSFHPNGKLKTAWLANNETIQGVPCAKFGFLSSIMGGGDATRFHDNGRLSSCILTQDITIEGKKFKKGDHVWFDKDGKLIPMDKC